MSILLSAGRALHLDPVRVVDEAVEDGVGDGGMGDVVVPVFDGQLAGDDGRSSAVPVFEDLEHVASLLIGHRRKAPVVEYEYVDLGELGEQADVGAVGVCEAEFLEESWDAFVGDAEAQSARELAERATK